jgi:hypothetical protein
MLINGQAFNRLDDDETLLNPDVDPLDSQIIDEIVYPSPQSGLISMAPEYDSKF